MKKISRIEIAIICIIIIMPFIFYGKVLFPGKMLYGTDWLAGTVMQRQYMADMLKEFHQFPLWNTTQFAGIPTAEGFFGDIFYPLTVFLRMFLPVFVVWTLVFILQPVIAGIGMYLFMRGRIQNRYISGFAAIAFMFTGVLISEAYGGHDGRVIVVSWLPMMMWLIDKGLRDNRLRYFSLAAIPSGMMLLSGHIQSSYYAIVFAVFYAAFTHIDNTYSHRFRNYSWLAGLIAGWLFSMLNTIAGFAVFIIVVMALPPLLDRQFKKKSVKTYSYLAVFAMLTVMISAVQYLPVMRFLPFAARGAVRDYTYATSWSMGISEILDLFFPGFTGINVQNISSYWGENAFKLHIRYIGIIPMILGISAMAFNGKDTMRKFFSISSVTVLILALGGNTPLYHIFHSLFPYVDKFRAPELIFFLFAFSMIVLAGLFLSAETNRKRLIWTAAVAGGIGIMIMIFPGMFESIFRGTVKVLGLPQQMEAQKLANMASAISAVKGSVIIALMIIVSLLLSLLYIDRKYHVYVLIALTVITAGDLMMREAKFIVPVDKPSEYFAEDNAVKVLKQDTGDFRIFPFSYRNDDYFSYFGFSSISGNHPSPFADYQKFINNEGSVMFNPLNIISKPERVRLLSVKYLVTRYIPGDTAGYDIRSQQIIKQYNDMFESMGYERFYEDRNTLILKAKAFVPRVFFTGEYILAGNLDEALSVIDKGMLNDNAVILNKKPGFDSFENAEAKINADLKNPNKVIINAQCGTAGMLVLTDQYYKAWKCTVDGKPADILKANGIFRAVELDKGEHEIIFIFDSKLQIFALLISIIAFAIIIIIFILEKRYYENSRDNSDIQ